MSDLTPPQPQHPSGSATPPSGAPAYGAPTPTPPYAQQTSGAPYQPPAYPVQQQYPGAAPAYGAPYGYAPARPTNTLAIVALIGGIAGLTVIPFIASVVGVITGHIALKQISRTNEGGRGMALAGVITGWVGVAIGVLFIAFIILMIAITASQGARYS